MKSFINSVTEQILAQNPDSLKDVLVVVPSKRSIIYFQKSFASLTLKATELPIFLSIEELALQLTDKKVLDPIEFLFEFYSLYLSHEKEEAQSFEEFSAWGPTMIKDFSDIDSQMIEEKDFFKYVANYFELQLWDPNPTALSNFQKKYIKFWKSLSNYYYLLNQFLADKPFTYRGSLFKSLALSLKEKNQKLIEQLNEWTNIYIVGFNALTKSEELIFQMLYKNHNAKCYFDADNYYLDKNHEAGHFIRKYLKEKDWVTRNDFFPDNSYAKESKNIDIYGLNNINELAQLSGYLVNKNSNSAIVLADESILLPVINHLPEKIDKVNITLGYPLQLSDYFQLFILIGKLQELAHQKKAFYHSQLTSILKHPVIAPMINKSTDAFIHSFSKQNLVFISEKYLNEKLNTSEHSVLKLIFSIWDSTAKNYLSHFKQISEAINKKIDSKLEREYLFNILLVFEKLSGYLENYSFLESPSTLLKTFETIVQQTTISFRGEPLGGTQIMGILETRLLDFEHLVLLSVNEGVLPKVKFEHSFIPFEIKNYFKLSTYKERDAIFAYHFYRLLQRSKNISLLYLNSSGNDMVKGEMSRYIMQISNELEKYNPKVRITHTSPNISRITPNEIDGEGIVKTEEVKGRIRQILEKGVSSTALTTYLNCPLDFYHKYILNVRTQDEVEEEVSSRSLGNIIHDTLEKIYTPFEGRSLSHELLKEQVKKIPAFLSESFLELYPSSNFKEGKNYLKFQLAENIIDQFLKKDMSVLKKSGPYKIEGLEKSCQSKLQLSDIEISIKGHIDRIQSSKHSIDIIDYKTGSLGPSDLKLKKTEDVFNGKKNKAFQLLYYALLYQNEHNITTKDLTTGIIHLKKINQHNQLLKVANDSVISNEVLEEFKVELEVLVKEMLDLSVGFEHNEESKYCDYC